MRTRSAAFAASSVSLVAVLVAAPSYADGSAQLAPVAWPSVQYSDGFAQSVSWSGGDLALSASGLPAGLVFTDLGGGTGSVTGTVQAPAGTYAVTLIAVDPAGAVTSDVVPLTVTPEDAVVAFASTNKTTVRVDRTGQAALKLRGLVTDAGDASAGDVTLAATTFYVTGPDRSWVAHPRVVHVWDNGNGPASIEVAIDLPPYLTPGDYAMSLVADGGYYAGSTAPTTLVVTAR